MNAQNSCGNPDLISNCPSNATVLNAFLNSPVTWEKIEYLARRTSDVIACGNNSGQNANQFDQGCIPKLDQFIASLVLHSKVQSSTLMCSLVYLGRLKVRLRDCKGHRSTPHRIFLASLIITAKYLNDKSPLNRQWARYAFLGTIDAGDGNLGPDFHFCTAGVNVMERQLLDLLSWNVEIRKSELYNELELFSRPTCHYISKRITNAKWIPASNPTAKAGRIVIEQLPLNRDRGIEQGFV